MAKHTAGIHHVTAFVSNAQETVDFYSGLLGLRMVKKTINFDAPEVYHLYFGDGRGTPGTIITFFPWAHSRKGQVGAGQVGTTTYVIPTGTMDFWKERLSKFNISYKVSERFNETYVELLDPDGLQLELVEREGGAQSQWSFGGVPAEKAIKGFGGAILYSAAPSQTAKVIEHVMGLKPIGQNEDYMRFEATGDIGNIIDVNIKHVAMGVGGAGTVHHIAWRAQDDVDHVSWRAHVAQTGFHPTPIIDRQYFNAIYFREEGGILFEIATDPPGFANDEPAETMGEKLMLPEWYEEKRADIVKNLPPIEVRVLKGDSK